MSKFALAALPFVAMASAIPAAVPRQATTYLAQNASSDVYPGYTVTAVPINDAGVYNLAMIRGSLGSGTPFTTSPSEASDPEVPNPVNINFIVNSYYYAMDLPEVGDDQGHASPITAVSNYKDGQWGFAEDGTLVYQLQAALDSLYICEVGDQLLLEYGVYNTTTGQPPAGCSPADIVKVN